MDSFYGEVISSYSRKDALNDGVLIDATLYAKKVGFKIPTALTRSVWSKYVDMPAEIKKEGLQSEKARLGDILTMLYFAISNPGNKEKSQIMFKLYVRNKKGEEGAELATLKALVHPDDDLLPVITIMLPDED